MMAVELELEEVEEKEEDLKILGGGSKLKPAGEGDGVRCLITTVF